ncbi:MAG: RNA polymerase sigma factor [Gemmatimonadaceae bacterium]|nr:RNA polymerase sigma factor [Gemmatimonadaceae bacterium]
MSPADRPFLQTSLDPPTAAGLLAAAASGSTEALATLYREHIADVYRVAARLTGSVSDAEDIAHDVFLGLPFALRRYEEQGRFGKWLSRITVRVTLNHLRSKGRRAEIDVDAIADLTDPGDARREAQRQLVEALGTLSPMLREVFVLHELEGYSHQEIAGLLEISVSASTMRLFRAWHHLRAHASHSTR